jgi:L-lysine 6-transaminase
MSEEIVGIIIEPIQGAGGHRIAPKSFFQGLSELAHRYGVYLAFDEVQTGLGAPGKMWAIDHFDLPYSPMAIAAGKKFGAGVVYMKEPMEDVGVLDSTWGGTLADMVRVVREVQIMEEEGLVDKAAENGELLAQGLRRLVEKHRPIMSNVRGLGLYQGFSLDTPKRKGDLIQVARDDFGLLLLGAGSRSIRTRPNLSVTKSEIGEFLELTDHALSRLSQ